MFALLFPPAEIEVGIVVTSGNIPANSQERQQLYAIRDKNCVGPVRESQASSYAALKVRLIPDDPESTASLYRKSYLNTSRNRQWRFGARLCIASRTETFPYIELCSWISRTSYREMHPNYAPVVCCQNFWWPSLCRASLRFSPMFRSSLARANSCFDDGERNEFVPLKPV